MTELIEVDVVAHSPASIDIITGVPGPPGPAGPAGPAGPPGTGGGGGTSTNEVWVDVAEPTDPAVEMWVDTSGVPTTMYIDKLLATTPFYVGHRGSGDVWPEHTMAAYQGAFDAGAQALEVSTQISSDGVWFCLHDSTSTGLDRTTTGTGDPATKTIAQLESYDVDIANCGPYWVAQHLKMPLLDDVFAAFFKKAVIFLETKNYADPAVDALLAKISAMDNARNYIIWKQHVGGVHGLTAARAAGFKTWCYIDAPLDSAQLTTALSLGDYIGFPRFDLPTGSMSDADVSTVVAAAGTKKVISYPTPRRSMIDHLVTLGVDGSVTPQLPYIIGQRRLVDGFASGKVAPGDIIIDSTRFYTLDSGTMWLNGNTSVPTVMMGSMTPSSPSYEITFELKYDTLPNPTTSGSGMGFSKIDDQAYQFQAANTTGGYHLQLRVNGQLQMYTHAPGVTTGTQIGTTLNTPALDTTNWAKIRVKVTPTTVEMQRMDGTPSAIMSVANTAYRGRYFHLSRNHSSGPELSFVRFRNVTVVNQ